MVARGAFPAAPISESIYREQNRIVSTTSPATQSLGAPKTSRGVRTRAKVLKAAENTFGTLGYHNAGVADITSAAGVAHGTFYTYFSGKEEVLRELVLELGEKLRAHLAAQVVGTDDRLEAEEEGLKAFLQYLSDNPYLYRILQEAQFVDEDIYKQYYESFAQGYTEMLDLASRKGEIRPGDNHHRAWALMGAAHFLGMKYAIWDQSTTDDESPFDPIVETMSDFFRNGLALKGRKKS